MVLDFSIKKKKKRKKENIKKQYKKTKSLIIHCKLRKQIILIS